MNGGRPIGVFVAFGLTVVALGVLVFLLLTVTDEEPGSVQPGVAGGKIPPVAAQREDFAGDHEVFESEPEKRLALVGTVVASRRRWSTATIVDLRDNKSGQYRIGDRLPTGARLGVIRADRVVLKNGDEREILLLNEGIRRAALSEAGEVDSPGERPESPEGPADERDEPYFVPEGMLVETGEGSYKVVKEKLERLMASPGDVLRSSMFTLAIDRAGRMEGLRLAIGPQGTLFNRAGLKSGDVIEEIGPLVLDAPATIEKIGQVLSDARELEVRIRRGGRPVRLRFVFE